MGIQLDITALQDSPEERELRRRNATRRRIMVLGSTLGLAVLARVLIKDPQPPAPPDYSQDEIRYIPGMLDSLPPSERDRLDPKIIARMIQTDENARRGQLPSTETMLAQGEYQPAEPKFETDIEAEKYKDKVFAYAKRRRIEMEIEKAQMAQDLTKTMLVRFHGGGYVKAEKIGQRGHSTDIRIDKTISAQIPNQMILSVSANALTWKEPVPSGFVRLKPAKGITITVHKEIANRISVRENPIDEI